MVGTSMNRTARFLHRALQRYFNIKVVRLTPARVKGAFLNGSRQLYQRKLVTFDIPENARVLDIGSGPAPFPRATVLCERYLDETVHRHGTLITHGIPMVVADIHALPFRDKVFDFVYSAHVLEHVEDPIRACREVMRVGKKGYLETPNFMKDVLSCQAEIMHHRWHTVARGNTLFFFEYSQRQLEGIRSSAWNDLIWSEHYHPLQDAFVDNQDLFNTMFLWSDRFDLQVVTKDGALLRSQ